MRLIKVKPKNGWFHATRDEMQKSSANMLAEAHCLKAWYAYERFTAENIYLPSIMHFFMGAKATETNDILVGFLVGETDEFFKLIGTTYEKIS